MKKTSLGFAALIAAMLLVAVGQVQANLLTNGDLTDPDIHEGVLATGWTLVDGPFIPGTPPIVPDFDPVVANFASFADHTTEGVAGGRGLWFRAFTGAADGNKVFAHLTQSVPGTAGLIYNMSAWSRFETHYAGGVDKLNAAMTDLTDPFDGLDSPTETYLALEFLDAGNSVLPGSVQVELRADGQANGAGWMQHFLSATAPAGTVSVQVRGSMIDGVINPSANPQSAFLDDFSLTAVPEPATVSLIGLALVGLVGIRRRSR